MVMLKRTKYESLILFYLHHVLKQDLILILQYRDILVPR